MSTVATTRMSSKGQIVIPEAVRKKLNLQAGAQFVVIGEDGVVILKTIVTPGLETFDTRIQQARQRTLTVGLTRSDIKKATKKVQGQP